MDELRQSFVEGVEQVMRSIHLVEARGGQREWELWAEEARSTRSQERWDLAQVKAVFVSDQGIQFTVTGAVGVVEVVDRDIWVEGDVLIRSANGYEYRTDRVSYSSAERRLFSPTPVSMREPPNALGEALTLSGQSLVADLETSLVKITGDVRGSKRLEKGQLFNIRSEEADFSGLQRIGVFRGRVQMNLDEVRVTGDRAEFEYDGATQEVQVVAVRGGVRASDSEKWVTSQEARAYLRERRFVFSGEPRVVQDRDELRGDKIVFLDGGRQVRVERARARVEKKSLENVN